MNDRDDDLDPVENLAEEFLERCRRGARPAIAEYTARFPELADRIRTFFPTLLLVEKLKPAPGGAAGCGAGWARGGAPERLGDYRILREVGRGGMGVVYEAEQESLGRRVALKVLVAPSMHDSKRLLRFYREAKAAARLHHTNIVPVFGVGEDDGTSYYVMQFIPGLGLDAVLKEVARLRGRSLGRTEDSTAPRPSGAAPSAIDVAGSLVSGRVVDRPSRERTTDSVIPTPAPGAGAPVASSPAVLPGQTEPSSLSDSAGRYARSVALIGVQVAEALEYAHRQGTLHRDIKPSNLLLDSQGTVWVTDFGLAKVNDSDDLTNTGDVVGTVRYMAPERFQGRCIPESDVYALGLTLYELLALRPAFDEPDRARLIHLVTQTEPPRLRKLEPSVPRDLETIVHKAIERDPAHRYTSAGDLAEDLRRFLDDRAIRARRLSPTEQAWRWCRRNPAAAALAAAVLALVMLAVGGGFWVQRNQAERRIEAARRQERARSVIEAALGRQEDLRRVGLWEDARVALAQAESRLDDADSEGLRRRLGQAQADLDYAMRTEAQDPGLVLRMAKAEARSGRTERFETLLTRAVKLHPGAPDTWKQRGLLLDELGQPDRAAADFARAVQLLPEDHPFDSPRSRLILELASHDRAFSKLLEARPWDHQLWIGRGRHQALCGRWRQAVDDFARGNATATPDTHEFFEYSCLLLIVGDTEGYRRLIRALHREVGETTDMRLAYELARSCIVAPETAVDPKQVIRWARLSVDHSPPWAWHSHVLGAAFYRAGDDREAIRWFEDSLTRPWNPAGRTQNQFMLAMARSRLGHAARARALLDEAVRWCEESEAEAGRTGGAVSTAFAADWLTIQLYRHEAESLFRNRETPDDPFAK
jgi:tetratricopeptide (TPR) repeat protein